MMSSRRRKEPVWRNMQLVTHEDVTVRVREYTFVSDTGTRHAAELSLDAGDTDKAIVEGQSPEELKTILEMAIRLFAVTHRMRHRAIAPQP
jgi:hypothetical protein